MSNNALVSRATSASIDSFGNHIIGFEALVEDNAHGTSVYELAVSSANFSPLFTNWRLKMRDAIIAAAAVDSITVTNVMFPDFSIL